MDELERVGALRLELAGCSDVALARNLLYTAALDTAPDRITVFLFVDDDMSFTPAQARLVVEHAEETGRLCSGVYGGPQGDLAAMRRDDGDGWWVGLGFAAVQREQLSRVAQQLPRLTMRAGGREQTVYPLCQSRMWEREGRDARWMSEDFWLCEQLGGALLVKVPIGHLKTVPLYPDATTLDRVNQ